MDSIMEVFPEGNVKLMFDALHRRRRRSVQPAFTLLLIPFLAILAMRIDSVGAYLQRNELRRQEENSGGRRACSDRAAIHEAEARRLHAGD